MPLTANRELSRYVDQELRSFPVAAAGQVFKGALVGLDRATGHVRNLAAGDLFAGIAYEATDNSTGAGGERNVRVYTLGDFILTASGANTTWVGAPVYAEDDATTTVLPTAGQSYCGSLIAFLGNGQGIVRIEPFGASAIEHAVHVPLASDTAAATVNPILIATRAVKLISAEVTFDTPPDQGGLDVGWSDVDPDEIVNNFNLAGLAEHTPTPLSLLSRDVAQGERLWARVGQASSAPGVGGLLSIRYIELP